MEQTWQGKWIWKKDSKDSHSKTEILYFRRVFDVPQEECSLVIHVSADSRYQLFFNGEPILVGPCKGDRYSHYYETIDLSDRLQKGRKNILAAKVIHFPLSQPYRLGDGPVSVWRSASGGFLLEGSLFSMQGNLVESIHTDESWRCLQDESLHFVMESWLSNFLGGVERVDGSKIPHGWHLEDFNDLHWSQAQIVANISNGYGILSPWQLEKRPIPLLFEKDKVFKRVMRSNHSIPLSEIEEENFYQQKQEAGQEVDQQKQMKAKEEDMYRQSKKQEKASSITIAAHSTYEVELDAGLLTTGYLRFSCSGGKGSKVSILCAECYEAEELEPGKRNKGVRDDFSQGKFLRGDSDVYQVAGIGKADVQQYETYEPFFFKTFRFVQLKIEVAEEPLQLHHFHYRETGYPLDVKGSFRSSDRSLDPLWEISINTLQRCMHETYEDCPYYEQLQYIMDTRLQILFTYYLSGDDRLARKAMKDFHNSLLPSGMLQSRYPSIDPQVIPGFSLYWIAMVYDHYNYFADEALAKSYLHTIDAILGWFESYRKPAGIVGEMPAKYWNFFYQEVFPLLEYFM